MKVDKIKAFLECVGVDNANVHKRTGWVISRCPLGPWRHSEGKSSPEVFGVRIESHDPHAHCFACGFHGSLGELVQQLAWFRKTKPVDVPLDIKTANHLVLDAENELDIDFDSPGIEDVLALAKQGLHVFPDWWLNSFPKASTVMLSLGYLIPRGVNATLANALDLRWDEKQRRVCFPVRDFKGRLVGLHGRAIDEKTEPRYRMYPQAGKTNPIAWLGESWVNLNQPIVVVEGPFDLASVLRVYPNAVSPLSCSMSHDKVQRMSDSLEWVTLFDRGAGGDKGRQTISKALGADHLVTHLKPPPDRKDPGEMTTGELVQLFSSVMQLPSKNPCKGGA